MDFLKFLDSINIDHFIVLIVILSGFFQDKYLSFFTLSNKIDVKYDKALKTLFLSLLASGLYIVLFSIKSNNEIPFAKYFISYFSATSLHELLINPFTKALKKLLGNES